MKKVLTFVMALGLVALLVGGGFAAFFSDTETATDNVFTAGSLDLKVNGQNGDVTAHVKADNMKPGENYNAGCLTLKNSGSLPGVLSVKVSNLVSNENGMIEPESSDGDTSATEIDPTGYDANSGDGELWDQITVKLCLDDGTGAHTGNGQCDWDDTILKGFSSTQDDYSETYSINLDTDLADGMDYELGAGEAVDLCVDVKFIDDTSNSWWGAQGNLSNNMAMTDDALFDLELGLVQK